MSDAESKPAKKPVKKPAEVDVMTVTEDLAVSFHYKLAEVNKDGVVGPWLERSSADQPLWYLCGHGNVVSGLEAAMLGKKVGDKISITLAPEQAYGERRSNSIQRVPIKHLRLPSAKKLSPGMVVGVQTNQGVINALIVKAGRFNVDIDTNHPFAGRTLHYEIEIVELRVATVEELEHRHVHGPGAHHH